MQYIGNAKWFLAVKGRASVNISLCYEQIEWHWPTLVEYRPGNITIILLLSTCMISRKVKEWLLVVLLNITILRGQRLWLLKLPRFWLNDYEFQPETFRPEDFARPTLTIFTLICYWSQCKAWPINLYVRYGEFVIVVKIIDILVSKTWKIKCYFKNHSVKAGLVEYPSGLAHSTDNKSRDQGLCRKNLRRPAFRAHLFYGGPI